MAKQNTTSLGSMSKPKKKRPGIHSKKKNATSKKSKNYKKQYKGQGR
jgi:hypothetical protein